MKTAFLLSIGVAFVLVQATPLASRAASVQGFDISNWQPDVDFEAAYKSGARFVIIKVCWQAFFAPYS